jgi:hypothetical protein
MLLGSVVHSQAALTNLVINGEFESPVLTSSYQTFSNIGTQWTSSAGNQFELWQQGFNGTPVNGTDGSPAGQSLELRGSANSGTVTLMVNIPTGIQTGSQATLNFDAWNRGATQNTGRYQILVGAVSQGTFTANTTASSWTANSRSFNVSSGDMVSVIFSDVTSPSTALGLHLDEVELLVNLVPEPGLIGAVLTGLVLLLVSRKRFGHSSSRHSLRSGLT